MERSVEYGSFAKLFGQNSMGAWTRSLLEDRRCMDCKAEIEDFEGAMVFCGRPPRVNLVGQLCEACCERREEVRRYRLSLTIR